MLMTKGLCKCKYKFLSDFPQSMYISSFLVSSCLIMLVLEFIFRALPHIFRAKSIQPPPEMARTPMYSVALHTVKRRLKTYLSCPGVGVRDIKRYRDPSVCLSQPRLLARWLPAAGRPPEMCGLRTRPRTDIDPRRESNCHRPGGAYRLVTPGR